MLGSIYLPRSEGKSSLDSHAFYRGGLGVWGLLGFGGGGGGGQGMGGREGGCRGSCCCYHVMWRPVEPIRTGYMYMCVFVYVRFMEYLDTNWCAVGCVGCKGSDVEAFGGSRGVLGGSWALFMVDVVLGSFSIFC